MKRKRNFKACLFSISLLVFLTGFASAQDFTVKGKVTDVATGEGIPGVNIILEGTITGTVSNLDGDYTISVPNENAVLVYSFLGYLPEKIQVGGQSNIDVSLIIDIMTLDELVVIGYGSQKKSDLTGAVAVVNVEDIKKTSTSNMGTMLQGRVPGVTVTSDGQPGADPSIRIRGIGTFNNSDPLYVIDGVIIESGSRDFSPNDIETMQILKDASAAAIYGSRAANGVIIITTKKGKKNTPLNVAYSGYFGMDKIANRMPVLKREDYQTTYNTSLSNMGLPLRYANDPNSVAYIDSIDTDWQEEGFKTGYRKNHNLALTGGGETGTYAIILDYLDSRGTLVGYGPDYKRYSVRSNTTVEKKFFNAGASLVYTHTDQNTLNDYNNSSFSGGNAPIVNTLTSLIPTMAVYDENSSTGYGSYDPAIHGEDYSLNIIALNNLLENRVNVDRMLVSGYVGLKIGEIIGLQNHAIDYKLAVSYDKTNAHDFRWIPEFSLSNFYTITPAVLQENWRQYTTGLVENTISFSGDFSRLNYNAVFGHTFQSYDFYNIEGNAQGFPAPYYPKLTNGSKTSSKSREEHSYLESLLARATLNYDDRYLLTGTVRRDGTSRVSADYRYGAFPSISAGWKVHNESFFPVGPDVISEFKLRGGWGLLGNQAIGPYEYLAVLNRNVVYNFNGQMVQGSTAADVFPDKLLWEEKEIVNIAADLSFLNRKMEFTVEYFNAQSHGILVEVPIPLSVGSVDDLQRQNAAEIENKGFEFVLGYREREREFNYDVSVNASFIKNKVISLGGDHLPVYGAASRTMEGEEIGRHYGYVYDGIFQTQPEVDASPFQTASTRPGDIKFKDLTGDNIINDDDKKDLGSSLPKATFGINLGCDYKNFDLSIFLNGATGYLVADNNYRALMHSGGGLNWHEDILDAWAPENTNTDIPRVVYQDANANGRDSDRPGWLQKGDFLRVANINLGYTFSKSMLKGVLQSARIYMSLQNLYTFTKYKGFNPDYARTNVWSPGYNTGSYPVPRTILFGVNLDF